MNRLRTFAGLVLFAGMLAGLTSCANFKGDLGADLDSGPVLASKGPGKSLLDVNSPADLPAAEAVELGADNPKLAQPQSVSSNTVTKIPSLNGPASKVAPVEAKDPKDSATQPESKANEAVAIELKEVKKNDKPVADTKDDKGGDEAARRELEKMVAAKAVAEKADAEKLAASKAEAERLMLEKFAAIKRAAELKVETDRVAKDNAAKAEADKVEAEKVVAAKHDAVLKAEAERIEREQNAGSRLIATKLEAERNDAEAAAIVKRINEREADEGRVAAAKVEADRIEKEKTAKVEADRIEAEKLAAAKKEAEVKAEAERAEQEQVAAARIAAVKAEIERNNAEVAAVVKRINERDAEEANAAAAKTEADKVAAAKIERDRVEAEAAALAKSKTERDAADALVAQFAAEKAAAAQRALEKVEGVKPEVGNADAARVAIAAKIEADKAAAGQAPVIKTEIKTEVEPTKVVALEPLTPKPLANVYLADDDKKPPVPPKDETPEQRAERLLREAAANADVRTQGTRVEADANYQAGMRAFNMWEYEKALRYFQAALALDPTHKDAEEKIRVCRSLLNIDVNPIAAKIRALEQQEIAKIQEQTITLAHALEEANSYEVRGSETVLDTEATGKTRALAERLRQLEQAQERYRRVREIINYLPGTLDLPQVRGQAEESLNRVRGKIEKIKEEVAFIARDEALRLATANRVRENEQFRMRVLKLLEQVRALYDVQDYQGAEEMAKRILIIDPMNQSAESWKKKSRSAYHSHESATYREDYREEYRKQMQDVDEALISIDAILTYPSNWDFISKRQDVTFGKKVAEETWKLELRGKLQRKVSFEFQDTPLAEAIEFLRHFANVTIIIDPKVLAANPPAINLRVTDMNLDLALEWILKLADLEYAFQDHAIFISKPANLIAAVEMKIYDVSDLTQKVQDFPGPEFQITVAGDRAAGGGAGGAANPFLQPPAANTPTTQSIADMIRTRVRPELWAAEQGTSIEERGGRLVVMQRPEVHTLIEKLLSNFRSTQKMMINIESRFLNIREAYLENIGVEYQGLDPNVLFGDFGDLRRLGSPTRFIQPRVPGSTDSSPGNLPFPGLVNGPDRINGGTFSQVGSVINHAINFSPNDPETISAQDPANTVINGGYSGQVTILNNTQLQAFIKALAVRENTSTLIAPRLTVFNTQRANMFVARQQSYVADYEISGDSYDPVIRQFLVGVVLDVKPIVSSDRRYVTLELRPTVTELVNFVTRQIDTFSVNSGAQVNVLVLLSFPIQFPELSIRRVRTTATVPDGGIMLVGGLYRNLKFNAENGIPFLSDLPVVGRLFRWNTVDNAKSNLAILVSPRIILFNEEEERLQR